MSGVGVCLLWGLITRLWYFWVPFEWLSGWKRGRSVPLNHRWGRRELIDHISQVFEVSAGTGGDARDGRRDQRRRQIERTRKALKRASIGCVDGMVGRRGGPSGGQNPLPYTLFVIDLLLQKDWVLKQFLDVLEVLFGAGHGFQGTYGVLQVIEVSFQSTLDSLHISHFVDQLWNRFMAVLLDPITGQRWLIA